MRVLVPLLASGLVLGATFAWSQTPPPSTGSQPSASNPNAPPSSSMNSPSTTGTANYSNGSGDRNWQMKGCVAQQKTNNPQATDAQIRATCQKLGSSSGKAGQ